MSWEFWIDVGGTFTDCLGRGPDGALRRHKLLSSGVYKLRVRDGVREEPPGTPQGYFDGFEATAIGSSVVELRAPEPAPVAGIRFLMGLPSGAPIGAVTVKLGTTKGTNALLERRGARVALVVTKGFADVLAIGYQNRPKLFALAIRKSQPLYETVIEADERLAADGSVLSALVEAPLARALAEARAKGAESVAIALLNSYKNDAHEVRIEALARAAGFARISRSSALSPLQRLVPRAETTVVDAYLTPVIAAYVDELRRALPAADLKLMTSAGVLADAARFVGKDSILSGPAGGVVGVMQTAREAGLTRAVGFDMGGTSTDVSRFDGALERRYEMEIGSDEASGGTVKLVAPMLAIETVAAGGGSLCGFDGIRLTVGPASAGAHPGPACYGRGGPLTITDCNLALGRLVADDFAFPLVPEAARARLAEQAEAVAKATGKTPALEELAEGYLAIAASNMAAPIKKVSLARGLDVREFALVSFGGAGAQHACQIADELGMRAIVQHPYASLLSAYGIGAAEERKFAARDVGQVLGVDVAPAVTSMRNELLAAFAAERIGRERLTVEECTLDLRYKGQDSVISVDATGRTDDVRRRFEEAHRKQYGFVFPGRPVEVRTVRLAIAAPPPAPAPSAPPPLRASAVVTKSRMTAEARRGGGAEGKTSRAYVDGRWQDIPYVRRSDLSQAPISGPALIGGDDTMIVVAAGWAARLTPANHVLLERTGAAAATPKLDHTRSDPVQLALFNNRFASIAEQMGAALQRTSLSVNVKERLDFSCAIFAPDGGLVVNAPHIPVHLGSMGDTVRSLLRDFGATMHPGDVYVTNDPYRGGSHLPDVTVITPVFGDDGKTLLFFTGNRAHHAEIGGITPGSMPPSSTTLAEEGVLIRGFRLVRGEAASTDALRALLADAPYPSRRPDDNVADIEAQVASNELGRRSLKELVDSFGLTVVQAYMRHIRDAAAHKMGLALRKLPEGAHGFTDDLDDGTKLTVKVSIVHEGPLARAVCDFTGTAAPHRGNLNANAAITRAAVFYVFRCLIDEDIPLNEGVLGPIELIIPSPSVLAPPTGDDPTKLAAVVGGNVETSQRLVDILLGALGLAAASQGTMNNFLFGAPATGSRPGFGYYETICGGAGAGPGFVGASAVHTHMTNTRITDAEVLEERFPVRVTAFAVRRGSGGAGKYPGGDGVVRELELLAPLTVSLITTRRATRPFGLAGGGPGAAGRNLVKRGAGAWEEVPGLAEVSLQAGDRVRLETPGGGGYGS